MPAHWFFLRALSACLAVRKFALGGGLGTRGVDLVAFQRREESLSWKEILPVYQSILGLTDLSHGIPRITSQPSIGMTLHSC